MPKRGLTSEEKTFYEKNGYVVVKGLLTKQEAAGYRKECHELAARLQKFRDIDAVWSSVKADASGKKPVLQHCHDVQFYSAAFARLIVDERMTSIAQSIIGPNVQLHHSKMFIKPPEKGAPFPMHQDTPYFEHEKHSMIAVIFHFDDAPIEKGCLRVVPGSHKLGVIPSDRPDHSLSPEEYPVEKALPLPAEAGDAVFFSYLTIHGSGLNVSSEARTTVLVQMRDPEDRPVRHEHVSRGQGMMLAGVDPSCCTTKPLSDNGTAAPAMGAMGAMGGGMMGSTMGQPAVAVK